MLKFLSYLLGKGVVTQDNPFAELSDKQSGLPKLSSSPCLGDSCRACEQACPTEAIRIEHTPLLDDSATVALDLASCINCSLCIDLCSSGSIVPDRDPRSAAFSRDELLLRSKQVRNRDLSLSQKPNPFKRSIACRVVSTGCSACDQEIGAAGNPIFDMERFGISIVASPRFADVLLITGPVPKAMHEPLKRCYQAMAEPRRVIAVGTCACSGGIHRDTYTEANGVGDLIPVDLFIPGCPPHPASILSGILLLMERLPQAF